MTSHSISVPDACNRLRHVCRWLLLATPALLVLGPAPADIAATVIALAFLWYSYRKGDWSWCHLSWVKMAGILWVVLLMLSLFAYDIGQAYEKVIPWPRLILFAIAIQTWLLDRKWLGRLILVSAGTLGLVMADTLIQYFTGMDLLGHARYSPDRLNGPFSRPKVGIYIAKFFFPVVLGLMALSLFSGTKRARILMCISAVLAGILLTATVFVSGERMALLMTVGGIILAALLLPGRPRQIIFSLLIAGIIAIVSLASVKHELIERQVDQTLSTLNNFKVSHYGLIWRNSLHMFSQQPWTGVGLRNFKLACDDPDLAKPGLSELRCATHSHNTYIEWLTEAGLPGLIGFLILVGIWTKNIWTGVKLSNGSGFVLGPGLAVFIMLWPIATSGSFLTNWNEILFWMVLGWALGACHIVNKPGDAPKR